ncbi:MAG: InlB B-repeat-containing protein [Treponema sp.]
MDKAINIDYSTSDIASCLIDFDPLKATCKLNELAIGKGDVVYEGETLSFTAILNGKEEVEIWKVKDVEQTNAKYKTFTYTVKLSDTENISGKYTIRVSYTLKEMLKIKFGEQIEKCVIPGSFIVTDIPIQSEDLVPVGKKLKFTAKLNDGEIISKLLVNSNEQVGKKDKVFDYEVKKADADSNNLIEVTFEKADLNSATLKFDSYKITCKKNYKVFETDGLVYEGDKLTFTATLKEGFEVLNWKVGANEKTDQNKSTFSYTVSVAEAEIEGSSKVIKVSYSEKELPKHHIVFDSSKVTCKKGSIDVSSDDEVHEKISLTFKAILKDGETLEAWYINDEKQTYQTSNSFTYKVDAKNAKIDSGKSTIKISYKLKTKLKIKFDENAMSATKSDGFFSSKPVHNNDEVDEGLRITFTAKLNEGERVDTWQINNVTKANQHEKTFIYTVSSEDGKTTGNEVTISYTKGTLKKFVINFEDDKMTCTKESKNIEISGEVFEGDKLKFTAKVARKEIQDWFVKDVKQVGWSGNN